MKKYFTILFISCITLTASSVAADSGTEKDATINEFVECETNDNPNYFDIRKETNRFTANGDLEIWVPDTTNSVVISEKIRKSRIEGEFQSIIHEVKTKTPLSVPGGKRCAKYTPLYKRSTINVTAKDADKNSLATKSIIAGPEEHWYLTFDAPLADVNQLTYNNSTSTVEIKEKPASFYLGLNWRIGDVLVDSYPLSEGWKNISGKIMITASGTPSESVGLGIGYNLGSVELFAARVRTKDDGSVADKKLQTTDSTIWGISVNISKGLGWF